MTGPTGEVGWERLFWLVFERTSNPVALLDGERRIVAVNEAGVALLGASREDLVGTSMEESVKPSERAVSRRDWRAFLKSGQYTGTRDVARPDGTEVAIDFAARMADVGGRRLAIYVALVKGQRRGGARTAQGAVAGLTNREREVVTLIALGRETGQIATELHISAETVRTHVRNAMSKLGAHTRAQLVAVVLSSEQAVHDRHVSP